VSGASVLLALRPDQAIIGDLNEWLLDTYVAIRNDWERVAGVLNGLKNSKEEYLRIRSIPPASLDLDTRAAHFVYLNKTCFRGLFRVNGDGQFNVPYGAYNRRYYDPNNFRAVAAILKRVEIRCKDFELCLADVTDQDFIYFDPPYYKLGGYSDFNRYTRYQFRENDHIRLAALCRELDERGVRWAVSNSDTPFIHSLFRGFEVHRIANRREINLQSSNRDISELLICNYPASPRHARTDRAQLRLLLDEVPVA